MAVSIFLRTSSLVYGPSIKWLVAFGNVSNFSNSAVKIPDSQGYKIYENDKEVLRVHL